MSKSVLAVDVDDVIAEFMKALCTWYNGEFGTTFSPDLFKTLELAKGFGISETECYKVMDDFYASSHFLERLEVIEGAQDALKRLSQFYELAVVTSRSEQLKPATTAWLDKHFSGIFSRVEFGNHWAPGLPVRSKAQICIEIGAFALVDDHPKYVKDACSHGIKAFLFGEHTWNQTDEPLHENIRRVKNWTELMDILIETKNID